MADLDQDVMYVKGVGPQRVKLLNHLGIQTLEDLITYFPRDYEDRSKGKPIIELEDGESALFFGSPQSKISEIKIRKGLTIYKLVVRDETATCIISWFNQPYLKNRFKVR